MNFYEIWRQYNQSSDYVKLYITILILSDVQIIKSAMENDKEKEVEDDSSVINSGWCKEALKVIITLRVRLGLFLKI